MLVLVGLLDALVLGPPVLEPDFDLGLGEAEGVCQLGPPGSGHVLGARELQLQPQRLVGAEGGALPPRATPLLAPPPGYWNTNLNVKLCRTAQHCQK